MVFTTVSPALLQTTTFICFGTEETNVFGGSELPGQSHRKMCNRHVCPSYLRNSKSSNGSGNPELLMKHEKKNVSVQLSKPEHSQVKVEKKSERTEEHVAWDRSWTSESCVEVRGLRLQPVSWRVMCASSNMETSKMDRVKDIYIIT